MMTSNVVGPTKQPQRDELPLWEAGIFGAGVTQPAYPGAAINSNLILALPFVVYRGEVLRIDRSTVGLRAIRTPRTELDVGFAASLGSRAGDIPIRRGMDDLGTLVEFGSRLKVNLGDISDGENTSRIQLPVRMVFDVNDHMRYKGISCELQWVRDLKLQNDWLINANLAAVFGEQQLVDTFYRVAAEEATVERPAYAAKSGLIALRASLFATRLITPDARIFGYFRVDTVAGAANHDSPLVEREAGWTFGVGMAITFAQSELFARN